MPHIIYYLFYVTRYILEYDLNSLKGITSGQTGVQSLIQKYCHGRIHWVLNLLDTNSGRYGIGRGQKVLNFQKIVKMLFACHHMTNAIIPNVCSTHTHYWKILARRMAISTSIFRFSQMLTKKCSCHLRLQLLHQQQHQIIKLVLFPQRLGMVTSPMIPFQTFLKIQYGP